MAYHQHPLDVTTLPAWQALRQHREDMQSFSMRDAFASDAKRFERFSMSTCGLFLDYSKNRLDTDTLTLLHRLARDAGVAERRAAMFAGERINTTEGRAVLHTALRRPMGESVMVDGKNIMRDVHTALAQMTDIVTRIHNNLWRGFSDKDISNEYTNQGWVLGLRYKFDEDLFRGKDAGVNKTLSSGSPAQP